MAARYGITGPTLLTDRLLKLGLDLKGGVHLVLRVQTDDALRIESETEMERLRELLSTARINSSNLALAGIDAFKVEGISGDQDAAFRAAANEVSTNFDRDAGTNGTYTFRLVVSDGQLLSAPDDVTIDTANSAPVADAEVPWKARSVELVSATLGVSGKIDLVEGADGEVMPVEDRKSTRLNSSH